MVLSFLGFGSDRMSSCGKHPVEAQKDDGDSSSTLAAGNRASSEVATTNIACELPV